MKLRAIYKRGYKSKYEVIEVENELAALQELVKGHIEAVAVKINGKRCTLICNDEGAINGMHFNDLIEEIPVCGPFLVFGDGGEDLADISTRSLGCIIDRNRFIPDTSHQGGHKDA